MTTLEEELVDLGSALDVPAGDSLAAAVGVRLRADESPLGVSVGPGSSRRRIAVLAAAVTAVIAGAVAAPAVADWFGVRGVEVSRPQSGPSSPTTIRPSGAATTAVPALGPGQELDLGERVALSAATEKAGFAPVVPTRLGPPDAVWVDRRSAVPFVSLVYEAGPLVSQFDATIADDPVISKMARADTTIEELTIDGERALWIAGVHEVALRTKSGRHFLEPLRLSDSVLLVEHGRLTIRIETSAGRDEAIRIAESLP